MAENGDGMKRKWKGCQHILYLGHFGTKFCSALCLHCYRNNAGHDFPRSTLYALDPARQRAFLCSQQTVKEFFIHKSTDVEKSLLRTFLFRYYFNKYWVLLVPSERIV